jgi:cell division protein FtsB
MVFGLLNLNPIEILFLLVCVGGGGGVALYFILRASRTRGQGQRERNDQFVADLEDQNDSLSAENQRLREELARLKNERTSGSTDITNAP